MTEPVRILCVDDEKNVLRSLERLFMDEYYEILTASSGGEGLELLRTTPGIQLIISDYRMPEMSGVEFLKQVYEAWPDTVRIVLSGYADASAIVSAINEGHIYKFIPKPWNDDELKVAVANAIERYYLVSRNNSLTAELTAKNAELERLLEEKSEHLRFRERILKSHQTILDAMPVAIMGVDDAGDVALCNQLWIELSASCSLGANVASSLPADVIAFLEEVKPQGYGKKRIGLGPRRGILAGRIISGDGDQRGTIVAFMPEDDL